jgi:PPM family protein phosphatase
LKENNELIINDSKEVIFSDVEYVPCPNPTCDSKIIIGHRFCEECGARVTPAARQVVSPLCISCGSDQFDSDGYCEMCGTRKACVRNQEDEIEIGPGLAGATDIGLVHKRNDDAFDISGPTTGGVDSLLVVCDGVSNSQNPDIASAMAVKICTSVFRELVAQGETTENAITSAIKASHNAVCSAPLDASIPLPPPQATIAVAYLEKGSSETLRKVTVGWLGDSRISWLSYSGGKQLTRDHSWCNYVVDIGEMSELEAKNHRLAHAITKCLGAEDVQDPYPPCCDPDIQSFELPAEGWLAAYTDGLWNYAETTTSVMVAASGALSRNASDCCQRLIATAKARGGHDNITIAITRM